MPLSMVYPIAIKSQMLHQHWCAYPPTGWVYLAAWSRSDGGYLHPGSCVSSVAYKLNCQKPL